MQDLQHAEVVGRHPGHLVRCRAAQGPRRQHQAVPPQVARHRVGALQLAEPGEHQLQPCLHFLVRVEDDLAPTSVGKAGR